MTYFFRQLERLCKERGTNLKAVCDAIGLKYKTINNQKNEGRKVSWEHGDAFRIYFGVPPEYFSKSTPRLDISAESEIHQDIANLYSKLLEKHRFERMIRGENITIEVVLDWLERENYTLRNFEALSPYVDLFHVLGPDDQALKLHELGRNSLVARHLKLANNDHFNRVLPTWDPSLITKVTTDHRAAAQRGSFTLSSERLNTEINGQVINETYRRLLAPVTDTQGRELIFNWTQLTSVKQVQR